MSERVTLETDADKPDEWHFRSMRCALVAEQLGGVSMPDSSLFKRAVGALLQRGYTEDQIIEKYRARGQK